MRPGLTSIVISGCLLLACGADGDPANPDPDASAPADAPGGGGPDGASGVDAPPGATSLVIFLTSSTQNADFGGLAGADALCNNLASDAGLPGSFIAWLSVPGTDAADRLAIADLPFVRTDGTAVAGDLADLIDGSIASPINRDENGTSRSGDVWTGTLSNGTASVTCGDFDTTGGIGQCGSSGSTGGAWTENITPSCATGLRLYCVEQ